VAEVEALRKAINPPAAGDKDEAALKDAGGAKSYHNRRDARIRDEQSVDETDEAANQNCG
jgi:hypothetical protein